MTARTDQLVNTKNRIVVMYNTSATGGNSTFSVGPSVFGPTSGEFATSGLTYNSAALSRIAWGCDGSAGNIEIKFTGATAFTAFVIPAGSAGDLNLEKLTIPNLSYGSTGMASVTNSLSPSTNMAATVIMEFVTRHV